MNLRLDRSRWQPGRFISDPVIVGDVCAATHDLPFGFKSRELVRISDEAILKAAFESLVEMIKRKEGH